MCAAGQAATFINACVAKEAEAHAAAAAAAAVGDDVAGDVGVAYQGNPREVNVLYNDPDGAHSDGQGMRMLRTLVHRAIDAFLDGKQQQHTSRVSVFKEPACMSIYSRAMAVSTAAQ